MRADTARIPAIATDQGAVLAPAAEIPAATRTWIHWTPVTLAELVAQARETGIAARRGTIPRVAEWVAQAVGAVGSQASRADQANQANPDSQVAAGINQARTKGHDSHPKTRVRKGARLVCLLPYCLYRTPCIFRACMQ